MLKKILSISGRPGLFKLVAYGKNMLLVEGLADFLRIHRAYVNQLDEVLLRFFVSAAVVSHKC